MAWHGSHGSALQRGMGGRGGLPNSQPAPGAVDSLDRLVGGLSALCQLHALAFPPCTDLTATKLEHGCSIDRKRRAAHAVSDLRAQALHRTYRGTGSAVCPLARLTWAPIGPVPKREGPSGLVGMGLVGKGLVGKGLVGKGLVGLGLVGMGLVGKGSLWNHLAPLERHSEHRRRSSDRRLPFT
jgi:hypothetical protein